MEEDLNKDKKGLADGLEGNNDKITVGGTWDDGEKSYGRTVKNFEIDPGEVVSREHDGEDKKGVFLQFNRKLSMIDYDIKDDEAVLKKTFSLKESIVVMINQLKLVHPNANARYNSIVEKAIKHYYKYIMEEGGSQED